MRTENGVKISHLRAPMNCLPLAAHPLPRGCMQAIENSDIPSSAVEPIFLLVASTELPPSHCSSSPSRLLAIENSDLPSSAELFSLFVVGAVGPLSLSLYPSPTLKHPRFVSLSLLTLSLAVAGDRKSVFPSSTEPIFIYVAGASKPISFSLSLSLYLSHPLIVGPSSLSLAGSSEPTPSLCLYPSVYISLSPSRSRPPSLSPLPSLSLPPCLCCNTNPLSLIILFQLPISVEAFYVCL